MTEPVGPHPRYSAFSAGPAGLVLMFSNMVFGIVVGALAGAWSNPGGTGTAASDSAPLTGLLGGVVLGAVAAGYQYAVWTNYPRAAAAIVTLASGFMLGFGLLDSAGEFRGSPNTLDAIIVGAVMEAAFFAFLGITHEANMTAGDAFCTSVGAIYGFAIAALVLGYIGSTSSVSDASALLYGPAIGEIAGGILAYAFRPTPRTVAIAGLIPLGITAVYMTALSTVSGSRPAYWGAAIGVLVVSAVVTGILSSGIARPNEPAPAPALTPAPPPAKTTTGLNIDWMPTVTLAPDTVHGRGTVPGIGVVGRF